MLQNTIISILINDISQNIDKKLLNYDHLLQICYFVQMKTKIGSI